MTVTNADALVRDYIARLERAAAALPEARRQELVADVLDHIHAARGELGDDEAAVRTMIDRLGSPEEIVAAEGVLPLREAEPRLRTQEVAALVLLPLGGFFLGVGWLVGVVLLWLSDRWSSVQKVVGTLVWPFGLVLPVALSGLVAVVPARICTTVSPGGPGMEPGVTCESVGAIAWAAPLGALVSLLAPILVVAWLARTARSRSNG